MIFRFRRRGQVAVVELFGVIGGAVRSAVYGRIFDDIRRSRAIRALVVDIDSPGGSAIASEYLHYSLSRVAESKPVVGFRGGRGASGGYMLSCAAKRVVSLHNLHDPHASPTHGFRWAVQPPPASRSAGGAAVAWLMLV